MVRTKANSMARKAVFDKGLGVIEESQMTNILLYILENGGCRKSEIYKDLPRSSRYPEKLARLEEAGLIVQRGVVGRTVLLDLTEKGERVARLLAQVGDSLREGDG